MHNTVGSKSTSQGETTADTPRRVSPRQLHPVSPMTQSARRSRAYRQKTVEPFPLLNLPRKTTNNRRTGVTRTGKTYRIHAPVPVITSSASFLLHFCGVVVCLCTGGEPVRLDYVGSMMHHCHHHDPVPRLQHGQPRLSSRSSTFLARATKCTKGKSITHSRQYDI